jgi:hypothetical protein
VRPEESAPASTDDKGGDQGSVTIGSNGPVTIADAVLSFIDQSEGSGLAHGTKRKKRTVFSTGKPSLLNFAKEHGLRYLHELDIVLVFAPPEA